MLIWLWRYWWQDFLASFHGARSHFWACPRLPSLLPRQTWTIHPTVTIHPFFLPDLFHSLSLTLVAVPHYGLQGFRPKRGTVISQTFTYLFQMLPSVTELLQALPSLLSTLTWSSQPQPCYVTSECLTHLISPSISIPYLPPYKLIPLLLMFRDTAAAQGSPAAQLRSGIAPVWLL